MGRNLSHAWLSKAKDDLAWTEANIREHIYYGACFTAQQAAEKALKAYLLGKEEKIRKIHDLGALPELCRKSDPAFSKLRKAGATLTNYYLVARYPDIGEFMSYSEEQAKEAYELAKETVIFVESKMKLSPTQRQKR